MAKRQDKILADKSVSLFRKRRVIILLLFIFLILSVTIGVLTIYGTSTGGFTVDVPEELEGIGIGLCETKDSDPKQVLNGNVLSKASPVTMGNVNKYTTIEKDGKSESLSGNIVGYTFYLTNTGTEICNLDVDLKITSATRNVDKAIRFWVFTTYDENTPDTKGVLYKSHDETEPYYTMESAYKEQGLVKEFVNEDLIFSNSIKDFKPETKIKFSIIMWLEGEDPDCIDDGDNKISGGSIKIGMSFSAYEEKII